MSTSKSGLNKLKLRPKYLVYRIEQEIPSVGMSSTDPEDVDSPFVLMPRKDPSAFAALCTYMNMCDNQLANEIHAWLKTIASADPILGTQGLANCKSLRMRSIPEVQDL